MAPIDAVDAPSRAPSRRPYGQAVVPCRALAHARGRGRHDHGTGHLGAGPATVRAEQVDLNLLVALDALLREQSVTRAAERLSVGQPAMSASLARLRRVFDDPLLVRCGRDLQPTPLAQSLAAPLRLLLDDAEDLLSSRAGFDPATAARSFTVMATDYVTLVLLRSVVGALSAEAPGVQVRIQPLTKSYLEDLTRHEVDLLVLPREVDAGVARLPHSTLFSERFVCVTWEGNEIGGEMSEEVFCRLPHLACAPYPLPSLAELAMNALGVDRNVEMTTQSFVMAPLLVRGTRLVAVVHERVARELALAAGARIWELPFDVEPVTEVMYWHPRSEEDEGHRWLRERIAAAASRV